MPRHTYRANFGDGYRDCMQSSIAAKRRRSLQSGVRIGAAMQRAQHALVRPVDGCPPANLHPPETYDHRRRNFASRRLLDWLDYARRRPRWNASRCTVLAPAGTGTTTLAALLKPVSRFAHHAHMETPRNLWAKGARCFLLTVRDPVERLVTAFSFEAAQGVFRNKPLRAHTWWDPRHWVRQFMLGNPAPRGVYNRSLQPVWSSPFFNEVREGGNPFLVPQASYLFDFLDWSDVGSLDDVDVHLICTRTLWRDWLRFLAAPTAFAGRAANDGASALRLNQRLHDEHDNGTASRMRVQYESLLSDENASAERDYLRSCLYAEDWALYRRFCRSEDR